MNGCVINRNVRKTGLAGRTQFLRRKMRNETAYKLGTLASSFYLLFIFFFFVRRKCFFVDKWEKENRIEPIPSNRCVIGLFSFFSWTSISQRISQAIDTLLHWLSLLLLLLLLLIISLYFNFYYLKIKVLDRL